MFKNILMSLLLFALTSQTAIASPPQQNLPENFQNRNFVPRNGYVRTNKLFFLRRRAQAVNPGGLIVKAPKVMEGVRPIPVILVNFKNRSTHFKPVDYQELLFEQQGSRPKTVRPTMTQFYKDTSHGRLIVTGTVVNWFTLPKNDDYYENNSNGNGPPFGELLELSLANADKAVDFGQFDNDGPDGIPNSGDDDGKVDTVFFVHSEQGAECNTLPTKNNIWSHSWHYNWGEYNHSSAFVTNDIRRDAFGKPMPGPDGQEQRILIDDYTIQPALSCAGSPSQLRIIEIGAFCHEYGHALGLPDLYDRTPRSGSCPPEPHCPDSNGIGNWGIMAGGSYGYDGRDHADTPIHMSAWPKYYLGWAVAENVNISGTYNIEPVEDRGRVLRVDVPNTNLKEYFLIEYRDIKWRDQVYQSRINWDMDLPASGLAIWHIDESVGASSPVWPFADDDKGQNDAPSRPNASAHSLVALEQADKNQDLEKGSGSGADTGDVWTAGTSFLDDPTQMAGSRDYGNKPTGIAIYNIDLAGKVILLQVPQDTAAVHSFSPVSGDPKIPLSELRSLMGPPSNTGRVEKTTQSKIKENIPGLDKLSAKQRALISLYSADDQIAYSVDFTGKRIEQLTGLSLSELSANRTQDAILRMQYTLPELIGKDIEFGYPSSENPYLAPSHGNDGVNTPIFEQVFTVDGKKLPVFGSNISLFYDSYGSFKGYQSQIAEPADLKVAGLNADIHAQHVKEIVQQTLGVDVNNQNADTMRRGIYLVDNDSEKARVAFEIRLTAGNQLKPIMVYLDAATETILDIR